MVNSWFIMFFVLIPTINAWKSSTEDQRDLNKYQRELVEPSDPTDYQKDVYRKTPIERRKTEFDPSERRKVTLRRELRENRKDPNDRNLSERGDPVNYRREPRELRKVHYHSKRHMLPDEPKKKAPLLKKPSGHLAPLEDDDMENDEVVSVAIGPPPLRGKFEKTRKKHAPKPVTTPPTSSAVGLVRDLLNQMTKEFLIRDVDENFVFGQYLGNSMKNLTSELRLSMQHEILELIVKYQRINRGESTKAESTKAPQMIQMLKDVKMEKKFVSANETDEQWPDFTNLAKIVG